LRVPGDLHRHLIVSYPFRIPYSPAVVGLGAAIDAIPEALPSARPGVPGRGPLQSRSPFTPAAACAGGRRRPRKRRRGAGQSCTSHTSDGRWRGPSWTNSWRRPRMAWNRKGASNRASDY